MKTLRTICFMFLAFPLLWGCGSKSADSSGATGETFNVFSPTAGQIPFPFDLLFVTSGGPQSDFTLDIPNNPPVSFVTDANRLDGFSTSATAFLDFFGVAIDMSTTDQGIIVINPNQGALTPGVDYEVVQSGVTNSRPRLLIRPLLPLQPATTHIVIATTALRNTSGDPFQSSLEFGIVSNPNPVGSEGNPVPPTFTQGQIATLEAVRSNFIRPIFDNVIAPNPAINAEDVAVTWNFTTQSIGASLNFLDDNAPAIMPVIGVSNTGMTTADINPALAASADVFVGTVDLPYYLEAASGMNDPVILSSFWTPNGSNPAGGTPPLTDQVPCNMTAPGESTTGCYPEPVQRSTQTVPVIVTVPNGQDGAPGPMNMPMDGWPVVIFQHGITGNRSNMFAIAPALAQAGFVTVAIDLPLHGITDTASPLYQPGMSTERTFNVDLVNNASGAPGPDSKIDSSGTHFINLASTITSRDNVREAVSGLIQLTATVRSGDIPVVNSMGQPTGIIVIDNTITQYVGHSLGGIVGSVLLGVNDDIGAATLAMPGSGTARLLDGSAAFGPRIAAGTAALGAPEGSDNYETLLRFTQTVVDSGDPINYAADANANHDIHLIEVVGGANGGNNPPDLVVPNFVVRNAAANGPCPTASSGFLPFLDTACEDGTLSGTNPLVNTMGLSMTTISPPYNDMTDATAGPDLAVRFTAGHHGSILDPGTSNTPGVDAGQAAQTTCEMQSQTATFLARAAAGAASIPIEASGCSTTP